MEEASTISKAIENAWNRAGQPQEFSVKILEFPKTSFFGLKTSKSAKIAFFFNELTVKVKEQPQQQRPARPLAPRPTQPSRTSEQSEQRGQQRRPYQQQRADRSPESRSTSADARPQPRSDQQRPQTSRADRPDYKQQVQQRPERQDHSFPKHGADKPSDSRQGFQSRHHEAAQNNNQMDETPKNISREPGQT